VAGGQNSTGPAWMSSLSPQGIMGGLEGMMTGQAYAQKHAAVKKPTVGGATTPSAMQFMDATQAQQPVTLGELLAMLNSR